MEIPHRVYETKLPRIFEVRLKEVRALLALLFRRGLLVFSPVFEGVGGLDSGAGLLGEEGGDRGCPRRAERQWSWGAEG
jgi:hypothetical protein